MSKPTFAPRPTRVIAVFIASETTKNRRDAHFARRGAGKWRSGAAEKSRCESRLQGLHDHLKAFCFDNSHLF